MFCGISNVVFLVNSSGGVFLLRVSGSARFYPAVHTMIAYYDGHDCMKTSSKYMIAFLLSMSGLKILHMKAEKAAGPMDIP